jgi:hypothetical protein
MHYPCKVSHPIEIQLPADTPACRTLRTALKKLVPVLLCSTLTVAAQQTTAAKPIDKAALTAAHSVYLMEGGVLEGHEDPTFKIFRATLDSMKRFTFLPDAHGADLILIFEQVPGRTVQPTQLPLLVLSARNPISLADLGEIEVPWAILPSLTKDQQAVTKLMNALFALDGNGAVPAFTVAAVPVNSLAEHLTSPLSILRSMAPHSLSDATQKAVAGAHTVIFMDDGMPSFLPAEYQQTTKAFQANLTATAKLHIVSSLPEADLVVRITGYQTYVDGGVYNPYIMASAFTPSTLTPVLSVLQEAKVGKTKKGKPSPFDASVSKLEASFEQSLEKIQRDAAKR